MEDDKNSVPDFDSLGIMETEGMGGFLLINIRNCDFLSNQMYNDSDPIRAAKL